MKKIKTTILIAIGVLSLSLIDTAVAQTAPVNNKTLSDEEILKSFDEKSLMEGLKKEKNVPESEYEVIIRYAKGSYIMQKRKVQHKAHENGRPPLLPTPIGPCVNAGFDDTTFTGWVGATGFVPPPTTWTTGFVSNGLNALESDQWARHTIMTNNAGFDINAVNTITGLHEIPYVAPGGSGVSVRLGNDSIGAQTEKLDYSILVTPQNTSFTYKYAVVLQNPSLNPHPLANQPRFDIRLYDQNGVIISGPCGVYGVTSSDASTDTSYHIFNVPPGQISSYVEGGYYKKWTTVTVDLTPYIGTTVMIEFQTSDCTQSGHFGYAYIDANCSQLQAQVAYCPTDTILMLVAPPGFVSYQWYDGSGTLIPANLGGTNDTLWVSHPVLGQIYSVSMATATGCATSLTVTLAPSAMQLLHGTLNGTCSGVNNGLGYVVTSNANPPFTYVWHDISTGGNVVGTNNDSLINAIPGTYWIHVTSAGGCSANDTLTIANPALPADTTFRASKFICPGDSVVTLYAPPGHTTYTWLDQNNIPIPINWGGQTAVVHIHNPIVPRIYYCSLDCPHWFADTLKVANMTLTPGLIVNDSCYNDNNGSASVNVMTNDSTSGPYIYTWTNTATGLIVSNSANFTNAHAGNYTVTVRTYGNCTSTIPITITQPPNTDTMQVSFSLCPDDPSVTLHVPAGYTNYTWYPNATGTGTPIPVNADSLVLSPAIIGNHYTCVMQTPPYCPVTLTTTLTIKPPPNFPNYLVTSNVFTPDGDNINDTYDVSKDPKTHVTFTYIKTFHIEIFNRWGLKVFESNDVTNQWDGKINGSNADEGVYYWMCSFTSSCSANNTPIENKGFVHLLRHK